MKTMTIEEFQANMDQVLDYVVANHVPVEVRGDFGSVVVLSQADYNRLQEALNLSYDSEV